MSGDKKKIIKSESSWFSWIGVISLCVSILTLDYVWGYRDSRVDSEISTLNDNFKLLDERVKSLTKYMNESSTLLNELIHEVSLPETTKYKLIDMNSKNREVIKYIVHHK